MDEILPILQAIETKYHTLNDKQKAIVKAIVIRKFKEIKKEIKRL